MRWLSQFGVMCCAIVLSVACRTALSEKLPPRDNSKTSSTLISAFDTDPDTVSDTTFEMASGKAARRSRDTDEDGFPDTVELTTYDDRANFRRWLAAIAVAQYEHPSREWHAAQRDCAGLVRFAWREALRPHTRAWQTRVPGVGEVADDVASYVLSTHPLGEKIFRTATGGYQPSDVEAGKFDSFADARVLKNYNARFLARDSSRAATGDLLFFHQPFAPRFPFHVMIFVGKLDERAGDDWIVYHTGASAADAGQVRLLRLATLAQHPQIRWRPVRQNQNFLGFYRLKILD